MNEKAAINKVGNLISSFNLPVALRLRLYNNATLLLKDSNLNLNLC